MTLNEIIGAVRSRLEPIISDDSMFDDREIAAKIHKQRALGIRNELNKGRTVDANIIQDLGCVELEVADVAECCDITIDCDILRTTLVVPNTVELHHSNALWVGPIDKLDAPFKLVSYAEAAVAGNGKFNQNMIYAFLNNGRVYVISKNNDHKYLKYINIRGVFEDPSAAGVFNDCSGSSCYTNDSRYPVNSWMLNYIEDYVVQHFIGKFQVPVDNSNDSKGDPKPNV